MRKPIFVRPLTDPERTRLETGLRSKDAFVLRRCQILLASARGERASQIATSLGCDDQTVRNVIRSFEQDGLEACLTAGKSGPKTSQARFDAAALEKLRTLLHQSPRTFGKPTSLWTLQLIAEVSFAEGIIREPVSDETIRNTLKRLNVHWKRAKQWISSPDPEYARKKSARDRLIRWISNHPNWVLGFQDETWWSRVAQPTLSTWETPDHPMRLVEQSVAKDDPDPKALACYGLLRSDTNKVWLRFVDGRPVSVVTTQFLGWCCQRLAAEGKEALLLVWDNASWHLSKEVRGWIRAHNRQVKRDGTGVRIIACFLPTKSPWLNRIEPHWIHGKREVVEPARLLTAAELAERVCAHFGCAHEPHLSIPEKTA